MRTPVLTILTSLLLLTTVRAQSAEPVVATIGDETITAQQLDQHWRRMPDRMRKQYEQAGGKLAFLDQYVRQRLVLQEALASGFAERPDVKAEVEAAKESTLFDLYLRQVVAAEVVTEELMRKFYDERQSDFRQPERIRLRQIVIRTDNRLSSDAHEMMARIMADLFGEKKLVTSQGGGAAEMAERFSAKAREVSEDPTAASGGDLGWVTRESMGQSAEALFGMRPGTTSGIIERKDGLYLFYVEGLQPAIVESFDSVRPAIRDYLMSRHAAEVLSIVNRESQRLRSETKVEVFPENVH